MADHLSLRARSANMSAVRGKDTKPERIVRTMLHRLGYRFRLHGSTLPGKPDIVFSAKRKVIFVHGCFWHGHENCRRASLPSSNTEFWERKRWTNRERDAQNTAELLGLGWEPLIVWQCELRKLEELGLRLQNFLGNQRSRMTG